MNYNTKTGIIGSQKSFEPYVLKERWMCHECQLYFPKGHTILASKDSRGIVRKKVCSDDCRLTFDDRFWQETIYQKRNEWRPGCLAGNTHESLSIAEQNNNSQFAARQAEVMDEIVEIDQYTDDDSNLYECSHCGSPSCHGDCPTFNGF